MATKIMEWHGFLVSDQSEEAADSAEFELCPFIGSACTKTFKTGIRSGVCTLKQSTRESVVCCPNRLYGSNWLALRDVAEIAFGEGFELVAGGAAMYEAMKHNKTVIAVFGKHWGGELHLPQGDGIGSYYVDYILAKITPGGLDHFVAVEVQSIDTTGNYQEGWAQLRENRISYEKNNSGFNWENVSKRILPQIIYKGNVLQQEERCLKGLFFITPKSVYSKIMKRLVGSEGTLPRYPLSSGSVTFLSYDPDWESALEGKPVPLVQTHNLTTSMVQVAQAFSGVRNLPPAGSYEEAIHEALI